MVECRTDAKERKLSTNDTLNATCALYFTQTWQGAHTIATHLPQSNENLAFFYLITPLNIPYQTCLVPLPTLR